MYEITKALAVLGVEFTEEGCLRVPERRIREVKVPDEINGVPIKLIESGVLSGRNLEVIHLPSKLEELGSGALMDNKIEELITPPNLKRIGYMCFSDNPILRIVMSPSLEEIDEDAFNDTTDPLVLVCQEGSLAEKLGNQGHNIEVLSESEMDELYQEYYYNLE